MKAMDIMGPSMVASTCTSAEPVCSDWAEISTWPGWPSCGLMLRRTTLLLSRAMISACLQDLRKAAVVRMVCVLNERGMMTL